MANQQPIFVAHRGYPEKYPENSLIGLSASLQQGAQAIEVDVQLTANQVPVLFHDQQLDRVTNQNGSIFDYSFEQINTFFAGETQRLGSQFETTRICSLSQATELVSKYPQAKFFVELKPESIDHFGVENSITKVIQDLEIIKQQCVIISYSQQALSLAKKNYQYRTGWILPSYDDESLDIAKQIRPDFLVCNHKKIAHSEKKLWPGDWRWVLYTIDDFNHALEWHQRGADYIETDSVGQFLC